MAGQVWGTNSLGGFMYSDNLSTYMRMELQPRVRFRQFADAKEAFGLGIGQTFRWNHYSNVASAGQALDETEVMPETNFTVSQDSLTIAEYGNSVPFTQKLDDLSEQPVKEVIRKVLANDAREVLDTQCYNQFNLSPLRVTASSATAVQIVTTGTPVIAHQAEMNSDHVKLVADEMSERDIPTYDGNHYMAVFRPRALRALKDDLEAIHQYTSEGWHVIMNGEKGRYEGIRFVEQTNVAAADFTYSDRGFFFGQDTVIEAFAIPEEIRGKIPTDYGRSRGVAWYAELGYGLAHTTAAQARVLVWDSLAAT
jgi:N4-gp56 family major capsid protein